MSWKDLGSKFTTSETVEKIIDLFPKNVLTVKVEDGWDGWEEKHCFDNLR